MQLRVEGKSIIEPVSDLLQAITNYALLYYQDVKYSKSDRIVTIPISRYDYGLRKNVLRTILPYVYDKGHKINSAIIIRNVEECNITRRVDINVYTDEYFSILFGLQINGNELFIVSAEEDRGETCYDISMAVTEIDIEIRDTDI